MPSIPPRCPYWTPWAVIGPTACRLPPTSPPSSGARATGGGCCGPRTNCRGCCGPVERPCCFRHCRKPPCCGACARWCWPTTCCPCATPNYRRCWPTTWPMYPWCCTERCGCCATPKPPPGRCMSAWGCRPGAWCRSDWASIRGYCGRWGCGGRHFFWCWAATTPTRTWTGCCGLSPGSRIPAAP